jgi:hypothetical protein
MRERRGGHLVPEGMVVVNGIDLEFFSGVRQMNLAAPTYGGVVTFPGSLRAKNAILYRTSWLAAALGEMRVLIAGVDSLKSLIGGEAG